MLAMRCRPRVDFGLWSTAKTTTSPTAAKVTGTMCGPFAPTVANQFLGLILKFARDTTTAALRGQATDVTASTAPGSGNVGLTFTALTTAPASGDTFILE